MHLNTYESRTIPDVFVTLPSTEARSLIAIVDKLSALRLKLFRGDYTVSAEPDDLQFLELVTARIAEDGYALHGFDLAVMRGDAEA